MSATVTAELPPRATGPARTLDAVVGSGERSVIDAVVELGAPDALGALRSLCG